ncbi:MAG: hypothetical protein ABSB42_07875 [Tepidisphaeraceae bacterium]|jgi:hypothetical protein
MPRASSPIAVFDLPKIASLREKALAARKLCEAATKQANAAGKKYCAAVAAVDRELDKHIVPHGCHVDPDTGHVVENFDDDQT